MSFSVCNATANINQLHATVFHIKTMKCPFRRLHFQYFSIFYLFFCKMQDELGRSQYLSFPPSFCNHVFIWISWKYQIVDHLSSYQNMRNRRHVVIFVSLSKGFIKPPNHWCMVYLSYWVIYSNCAIHYKGIVNGKKSYIKKQQS